MTRTFIATLVALHFLAAAFARPTAVGSAREAAVDDAAAQHVQAVQRGGQCKLNPSLKATGFKV